MSAESAGRRVHVLGSEDAESDDLLYACFVKPPNDVIDKSILAGRWGTGKTAYMFHKTAALEEFLSSIDKRQDKIWYIAENSLDVPPIKSLRTIFDGDDDAIRACLEKVWETAIVVSFIRQLQLIRQTIRTPKGEHWNYIELIYVGHIRSSSVWKSAKHLLDGIFGVERGGALTQVIDTLAPLTGEDVRQNIKLCIDDLPSHIPVPMVAVEPLETPGSTGTVGGVMADMLMTCLLNAFQRITSVDEKKRLSLIIAIPWHRFSERRLDRPQKLTQHIGHLKWDKARLRALINKRLMFELQDSRRGSFDLPGGLDAWQYVFGSNQKNSRVNVNEDTFDYVLRHTHYRVRELIRFSRRAIEVEANEADKSAFDVLGRRNDRIVSEDSLREAVSEISVRTAKQRITEGTRLYESLALATDAMSGMSCPFSVEELDKRMQYNQVKEISSKSIIQLMEVLWECGVIGAQITTSSASESRYIERTYGHTTRAPNLPRVKSGREDNSSRPGNMKLGYSKESVSRFYLFEHNTSKDDLSVASIIKYGSTSDEKVTLDWVFHPMMFEHLSVRLHADYVIGT